MITLDKPRDNDVHTLSDFAELLCLVTADRLCSRETVADQIRDVGEKQISDLDLDECFMHFAWRVEAFGGNYPFVLDPGRRFIKADEELTPAQENYAFLLICASLPYLPKPYTPLTDAFERLAAVALERILPDSATVKAFGKNETDYVGAKWQRINRLATQIGALPNAREQSFREGDNGDGGIDIAAWTSLDPFEGRNIPSALAQCACSREQWVPKQTEISRTRLGNTIPPTHPWTEIIFIPHSFRGGDGSWAYEGEVAQTVVMDRLRILRQLGEDFDIRTVNPPDVFRQIMETRLPLA